MSKLRIKKDDEIVKMDAKAPAVPDPFWPEGAVPLHLSKEKQNTPSIVEPYIEVLGPQWHCEKCGRTTERSLSNKRFCRECFEKEAQNTALARKTNSNWMEDAKELGLDIYERQPEENDAEWSVWTKYRGFYPLKLPTWTELAKMSGHSVGFVVKTANKWSFKVRLVAWARETDETIQEQRIKAIKEMNQKQLGMAQTIQSKLAAAINNIDPMMLKPGEIVNLFKVATELERRITTYADEKVAEEMTLGKTKQHVDTKPEDIAEILDILKKTGALDGKTIGVETTTRIIAKEG